ncbi:transcription factor PERIANTHIA-like [Trifolium medium]|uniref:Transcription factor PERIANTHIA-like n=1 Tax=Trifolium medium TaxID=97028 RepID=A0A392SFI9_9FABA|nr:transcription factor PERIANTHIA-like [Trifolium medium]
MVAHSKDQTKFRAEDHKTLRRLAQNREAARKSRLRKKVNSLHICIFIVDYGVTEFIS